MARSRHVSVYAAQRLWLHGGRNSYWGTSVLDDLWSYFVAELAYLTLHFWR